jgi:hypothetical protein
MDTYLVSKAPFWKVVVFNKSDNVGSIVTFNQYTKPSPGTPPPVEKIGPIRYAQQDCTDFGLIDIKNGMVNPRHRYSKHYYMLESSQLKQAQIIRSFYHTHRSLRGICLFDRDSKTCDTQTKTAGEDLSSWARLMEPPNITWVETQYIERKLCPESYFDYPSNFKTAKQGSSVEFGSAKVKQMEKTFLDELKVGE